MILEDVDQSALGMLVVNDEQEIVIIGQLVRIASALQIFKGGSAGFRRSADKVLRERDSGFYEAFHSTFIVINERDGGVNVPECRRNV